jgi:hypothetical protein
MVTEFLFLDVQDNHARVGLNFDLWCDGGIFQGGKGI